MSGLRKICKLYGSMKINNVLWRWDYVKDEPRPAAEMTKEEWAASEKARWTNCDTTANNLTEQKGNHGH